MSDKLIQSFREARAQLNEENEKQLNRDFEEIAKETIHVLKDKLLEKFSKKLTEIDQFYKDRKNCDEAQLRAENKELKAKLYDCFAGTAKHELELLKAKTALQDLLTAYSELSQQYHERSRELNAARDELEKYMGTYAPFRIKNEPVDFHGAYPNQSVLSQARDAISLIDTAINPHPVQSKRCVAAPPPKETINIPPLPQLQPQPQQQNSLPQVPSPMLLALPPPRLSSCESVPPNMLSEEVVDRLFAESEGSPFVFCGRLLQKYFTTAELMRNVNVLGNRSSRSEVCPGPKERLDPIRVDLIRQHVVDKLGGLFDEDIWQKCIARMNAVMNSMRKREAKISIPMGM